MLRKLLILIIACLATATYGFAQTGTITGTVTDASTGETIPTANVYIPEIQRGAATDVNGQYTIDDIPVGTYTLRVSFVGYTTYNEQIQVEAGENEINVQLEMGAVGLDQLVVTGYGITQESKSVASVSSLSGEELATQAVASIGEALAGQAAGVNIGTTSGQPGASPNISIRGVGSLNGATEPIVILNGTPINPDNMAMINMHSVKDINILKGPSATALYGSEGANGVIVIRTKTGTYNSPLQVAYSGSIKSARLRESDYDFLTGPEQLRLERSQGRHYGSPFIGNGTFDTVDGEQVFLTDEEIANAPTTDWVDYFFKPTFSQSHNLSFSRGYEDVRLYTAIEYTDQIGALESTGFKRYNLTNNLSGRSDDGRFTYNLNTMLSYLDNELQTSLGTGGVNQNPILAARQAVPYLTPGNYPGSGAELLALGVTFAHTPLMLIDKQKYATNETRETDVVANFKMSYELTDNLLLSGTIGGQYERENYEYTLSPLSFNSILFASGADTPGETRNNTTRTLTYQLDIALKYQTVFKDHHQLDAAVYFEVDQGFFKTYGFTQNGLIAATFDPGDGSGFVDDNSSNDLYVDDVFLNELQSGEVAYFGTLSYDYDSRFGVDLSLRRDGSYRFIDENRWGTFYSVGAYWNIAEESFMDGSTFGLLKLRAAYGKTGQSNIVDVGDDDDQFAPFAGNSLTSSLYGTGSGYGGLSSFFLSQLGNPLLKWETTYKINLGLDFSAFNARLNGSIDVYREDTEDLYNSKPVSAITSVTSINANLGEMRNQGIELELNYRLLQSDDGLNLTLGFLGSYNQNTILDIPDKDGMIIQGSTVLKEGGSLDQYYLVPYVGVNNETGNLLFLTQEGEETEEPTLPDDRRFTGKDIYPEFEGTVSLDLNYKGFFLLTDWDFTLGVYRFDLQYAGLVSPNAIGQFISGQDILDNWTLDNKDAKIPSYNASNLTIGGSSDRFLRDSDYFRLRFIKLGYQIPVELLQSISLSSATIYVSGTNIFAITPWKGLDPSLDTSNALEYPNPRIYSAGININF